jgi:hypothetical protein
VARNRISAGVYSCTGSPGALRPGTVAQPSMPTAGFRKPAPRKALHGHIGTERKWRSMGPAWRVLVGGGGDPAVVGGDGGAGAAQAVDQPGVAVGGLVERQQAEVVGPKRSRAPRFFQSAASGSSAGSRRALTLRATVWALATSSTTPDGRPQGAESRGAEQETLHPRAPVDFAPAPRHARTSVSSADQVPARRLWRPAWCSTDSQPFLEQPDHRLACSSRVLARRRAAAEGRGDCEA